MTNLWKPDDLTIIAEIGSNHDGDLGKALEYIDVAAECGADIVKFQNLSITFVDYNVRQCFQS